ncbi:MAG: transglutaminase family protein [Pirellulaceae bacterium]
MTRFCSAPALALVLLLAAGSVPADEPTYFSITMSDKLIGYAIVESELVTHDGRQVLRMKSQTSLKMALLGKERNTLLDSDTLIRPETGEPIRYRMTDTTNGVLRHVETEFENGTARTWTYREGDERGDPVETKLDQGAAILAGNNFAHWQIMLAHAAERVTDGAATVSVYVPDVRQVDRFELVRGETREFFIAGESRMCVPWHLEKANLNVLADARTNAFVRLEVPAQNSTVELADESIVKLAQKARVEEVLTRHFTPSNVLFDDFLRIHLLEAEIDVHVIGTGVGNAPSVLTTTMQQFDGKKEANHIVGTVRIRSVSYNGESSPPFPAPADEAQLVEWLEPSLYIESDFPAIAAKTAELSKEAKTRWDAVQRIGGWVHKEIAYVIADSPSARLALETRTGDCGPHSTLMVAMLRSAGIPARLVGGLVYTPTFGGSFGQHAWVEVHMGESGWLAVDPTTGEFQQLSATHIKLFSGLGGVLPKSVNVTTFEPPNRRASAGRSAEARPLPWKLGREYTFNYTQGDNELGKETFTIKNINRDGADAFELKSDIKLKINPLSSLTSSTTLVVAPDMQPLSFERDLSAMLQKVKIECFFAEGTVKETISGTKNLSHEVTLPARAYCFDNNLMGCFALICSQLTLEPEKAVDVQTFHPSSLQVIRLTLTPKAPAPIQIAGKEVECFECEVAPIKNTFWITRDGRFVRAKQGSLVIEVTEVD